MSSQDIFISQDVAVKYFDFVIIWHMYP